MQPLRIDEDTTLADEDEIHMAMVEFFEKWHKGADYLRTGIHDPDNNWLEIYENHDTFISMTADEEEENMFILQDVPQGKPGYRRLFG